MIQNADKAQAGSAGQAGADAPSPDPDLRSRLARAEAELAALRHSTSWRLTAPVRAVVQLFRGRPAPPPVVVEPEPEPEEPAAPAQPPPPPGSVADWVRNVRFLGLWTPEEAVRVGTAFDYEYYAATNSDLVGGPADLLEHYLRTGWTEGRNPSRVFSTSYYLLHAPDVAATGTNPFIHWVLHGNVEGRPALPYHQRPHAPFTPKISVIVPSYNHGRFLAARLDSILAQTYRNFDVIIVDDASTDDSVEVAERYRARHKGRIRLQRNATNSGNVFRQWRAGIEATDGDLIWICESDDSCDPDFLATLVPYFRDDSVNLAFGRTRYIDAEGKPNDALDAYRERAEPEIWDEPLVRPAAAWFAGALGISNVIVNIGGAVMRRPVLSDATWREAESYRVVGDWYLFSGIVGTGQIAYDPSAEAFFRQHGENLSVEAVNHPWFYEELARLMAFLRREWEIPAETTERFAAQIAADWRFRGLEQKHGPLTPHLDAEKLLAVECQRPHLVIGLHAFIPGGGEVLPVAIANNLAARGWRVSVVVRDITMTYPDMQAALAPGIAVYDSEIVRESGADAFIEAAGVSIIHSHTASIDQVFLAQPGHAEKPVPFVVSLHGSYENARFGGWEVMQIARGVSHYVFTTARNLTPFRGLPVSPRLFSKMANALPIDPRPFDATRAELGIPENAVVFTLVARGIKTKGWRASIKAFRALRARRPDTPMHLLLCGDGEEPNRHKAVHGADPNITFLGFRTRIHGLYRLSDVCLLPSRFAGESFPLVVLQALQVGVPVVATRIGEIPSMVTPAEAAPAGLLIEPVRDTQALTTALADAMEEMLDPAARARFAEAAKTLGATYDMDRLIDAYVDLYEKVLAAPGPWLLRDEALPEADAALRLPPHPPRPAAPAP